MARAMEFRVYRAGNENSIKLKTLFPNSKYKDNEITHKDRWINPYSGKIYGSCTEVLSMALTHFVQDPVAFYEKDREHFAFAVAVLRGWL